MNKDSVMTDVQVAAVINVFEARALQLSENTSQWADSARIAEHAWSQAAKFLRAAYTGNNIDDLWPLFEEFGSGFASYLQRVNRDAR